MELCEDTEAIYGFGSLNRGWRWPKGGPASSGRGQGAMVIQLAWFWKTTYGVLGPPLPVCFVINSAKNSCQGGCVANDDSVNAHLPRHCGCESIAEYSRNTYCSFANLFVCCRFKYLIACI